jgi:hypothetical protein
MLYIIKVTSCQGDQRSLLAHYVAQLIFLSKINAVTQPSKKVWATFIIFEKKLSKVSYHSNGEKSPNLVTLPLVGFSSDKA